MTPMNITAFMDLVEQSLPGMKYAFAIWDDDTQKVRSYALNGARTGVGEDGVMRFGLTEIDET